MSGFNALRRKRGPAGAAEHDECRPLVANRHKIAAHPRLNLAGSGSVVQVRGIKTCACEGLVDVLADRRGFRQREIVMHERRHPPGDRSRGEAAFLLCVCEQLKGLDVERQVLLEQTDERDEGIGAGKIRIDVEKHGYPQKKWRYLNISRN